MELFYEIAGWAGATAILTAYLAVSMGWLKAGLVFQTANLLGACAFIINGVFHQAWPSVVTNIAWCLISSVALLRLRMVTATVNVPQIQLPGVPETTGQLPVVEVLNASGHSHVDEQPPH